MTCIVAVKDGGAIYVGGDSAATDEESLALRTLKDPKVFINDNMIIGCCSSLRILQLMQHSLVIPDKPKRKDDITYLITDFIDAVRAMQKDKGSIKKENEVETHDSTFLIGYNGHIYYVEGDFQVYRTPDSFAAIGSGGDVAMGALYATQKLKMPPEKRLLLALEAAAAYNAGVRAPFHILKLDPEKEE